MLKEMFISRQPTHFRVNGIIKAFILSETFVWSAWNFVTPIFAVFATNTIPGGNVGIAASAYSGHLIVRVILELIMGKYLLGKTEFQKFIITIAGLVIISVAYIGFAFTKTIIPLYIFYGVAGLGLGIASPAKNCLFSSHLDKNKESLEWSMYDATVFIGMALSVALGGLIAEQYGFKILFLTATVVNLIGIVPYFLYVQKEKKESFFAKLFYLIFHKAL